MTTLKAFVIVFNNTTDDFFLLSDGVVELEDLKGYEGVIIKKTIYRSVRMRSLQRFALWLLGFNL